MYHHAVEMGAVSNPPSGSTTNAGQSRASKAGTVYSRKSEVFRESSKTARRVTRLVVPWFLRRNQTTVSNTDKVTWKRVTERPKSPRLRGEPRNSLAHSDGVGDRCYSTRLCAHELS